MSEVNLELIMTVLQRVLDGQRKHDSELAEIKTDVIEIKERLGFLEGQYGNVSRRLDRIGGDVEQIKRRLDLVDAP
jgi:predicted nuclease with TOPRIM domain